MTNPRNALRRLAASTTNYAGRSGAAHERLTQSDIAAALSAVRDRAADRLLRIKYAGDNSPQTLMELEAYMLRRVGDLALERGWTGRQPDGSIKRLRAGTLRAHVRAGLAESINPTHCPTCNGQRERISVRTGKVTLCESCRGTGMRRTSLRELAEIGGVDHHTIDENKLRDIKDLISGLEYEALKMVRRRLE